MSKVFHLHLRVEPFAVLFWAHVLMHILQQVTLAWHPSTLVLARYCTAGVS